MDDAVGFLLADGAFHGIPIAQIGVVNGHLLAKASHIGPLDGRIVEIVEIVENAQGVAFREEEVREIGADEPGAAREEDVHCLMGLDTKF